MRVAFALCLLATPAAAQRLTEGVFLPDGDVAAGEGAAMWETNPAGVGFGAPLELAYTFVDSQAEAAGEGHALGLSFGLDPFRAGLSVQFLDPQGTNADGTPKDEGPTKVSLGYALRLSPAFSFGFVWHTFVADDDPELDEADTWDVGIQLRPLQWLAAGVTVHDLTSPRVGGLIVNRSYSLGLSVRPGTERLSLTGTVVLPEEDDNGTQPWTAGGLLSARLFGSVGLQARYETTEIAGERSHRIMAGLIDLSGFGLGLFGYSPDLNGDQAGGYAVAARLRSSVPVTPTIFSRPKVVELAVESGLEFGPEGFFGTRASTPFLDTLITMRKLAKLEDVSGVLLSFGTSDLGWAQAAELRQAIRDLRAAGKKVYAWLPVGDTKTYAIASAADAIYVTPAGGVLLTGLRAELPFIGEMLEKLGISAEFVAIGAFKSAPEMFTRTGPSEAARAAENALLDDLYGHVVNAIAQGRGLTNEAVRALIDHGPYTAVAAKEAGLVDGVLHYDEFERVAQDDFGPRVAFTDADQLLRGSDPRWGIRPAIGVLYAVGTITDGRSTQNPFGGGGSTGAETFVRATRAMRDDPQVKAVVLRIDSPGGSVTAADAMWRELSRLAEEKPLIVSMGDVAASGGYYVAVPAREILALPETVTGSIGIFTGKFDITGLLGHLGIHREVFGRGANAGILSNAAGWTDAERVQVQDSMQVLYNLFLDRVAEGRPGLKGRAGVAPLAGGRVWTGAQARACGLVDRPAGFLVAVDRAAQAAGLAEGDYRLQIQVPESGFGGLPTSPLMAPLEWAMAALSEPSALPLPALTDPLLRLINLPLLKFASETPVALLPFEWR